MRTKGAIWGRLIAAAAIGLSLPSCTESELQVGSFKARFPSTKEAYNSLWDLAFEPSKRASNELLLAAKAGNEELVDAILSVRHHHDEDIPIVLSTEAKDANGWTPLMWAAHYNHIGIAEKLLDEDANAGARGDDGITPLALAVRNNNPPLVKLLLKHCDSVDTPDQQGITPLMLAVTNNNLELVRLLAREDANPNLRNAKGKSAVEIAEDQGN